jgi:uncharacterized protein
VRMIPPASRMAPLTAEELAADIRQSDLLAEYGTAVDRESARELLAKRMAATTPPADAAPAGSGPGGSAPAGRGDKPAKTLAQVVGAGVVGAMSSTVGRTVGREIVRGLFGLLGAKPPRTTTRRSRW